MQYFQVKPESDQVRLSRTKSDFLVANELYTINELKKYNLSGDFLSKHFNTLSISKNKTYFFFGARFISKSL